MNQFPSFYSQFSRSKIAFRISVVLIKANTINAKNVREIIYKFHFAL